MLKHASYLKFNEDDELSLTNCSEAEEQSDWITVDSDLNVVEVFSPLSPPKAHLQLGFNKLPSPPATPKTYTVVRVLKSDSSNTTLPSAPHPDSESSASDSTSSSSSSSSSSSTPVRVVEPSPAKLSFATVVYLPPRKFSDLTPSDPAPAGGSCALRDEQLILRYLQSTLSSVNPNQPSPVSPQSLLPLAPDPNRLPTPLSSILERCQNNPIKLAQEIETRESRVAEAYVNLLARLNGWLLSLPIGAEVYVAKHRLLNIDFVSWRQQRANITFVRRRVLDRFLSIAFNTEVYAPNPRRLKLDGSYLVLGPPARLQSVSNTAPKSELVKLEFSAGFNAEEMLHQIAFLPVAVFGVELEGSLAAQLSAAGVAVEPFSTARFIASSIPQMRGCQVDEIVFED